NPDGSKLATLSGDLRIWDRATGKLLATFEPNENFDWSVAFSPDGKSVLSAHTGGKGRAYRDEVWIWNLATGRRRALFGSGDVQGRVTFMVFSRDGKTLALHREIGRDDRALSVHDFPSGKHRGDLPTDDLPHLIEDATFDSLGRLVVPSAGIHVFDVTKRR